MLSGSHGLTMFKLIRLQFATALLGILCGALVAGLRGAVSAAIGGFACVVPSLLFACYLQRATECPGSVRVLSFFVGEAMKIALVVGLLCLAPKLYPGMEWKSLLIGLVVTLQANFLVFKAKT
jgi:ATP synthase protein I